MTDLLKGRPDNCDQRASQSAATIKLEYRCIRPKSCEALTYLLWRGRHRTNSIQFNSRDTHRAIRGIETGDQQPPCLRVGRPDINEYRASSTATKDASTIMRKSVETVTVNPLQDVEMRPRSLTYRQRMFRNEMEVYLILFSFLFCSFPLSVSCACCWSPR